MIQTALDSGSAMPVAGSCGSLTPRTFGITRADTPRLTRRQNDSQVLRPAWTLSRGIALAVCLMNFSRVRPSLFAATINRGSGRRHSRERFRYSSVANSRSYAGGLLLASGAAVWQSKRSTVSGSVTSRSGTAPSSRRRRAPSSPSSTTPSSTTPHALPLRGPLGYGGFVPLTSWTSKRPREATPTGSLSGPGPLVAHEALEVRSSARKTATARRRLLASQRVAPLLAGLESNEGVLRRRRDKAPTRARYAAAVNSFMNMYRLTDTTPKEELDWLLDKELDRLYLTGESAGPGRCLFYAVRWHFGIVNADLPKSSMARQGHTRMQRSALQDPIPWEEVLVMVDALLSAPPSEAATQLKVAASIGMIIAFDVYGRANDVTTALRNELRPPAPRGHGGLRHWTLTFFPETQSLTSKTHTQDDTVTIGSSNPQRKWISQLCPLLLRVPTSDGGLLGITRKQYQSMFYLARRRAGLSLAGPHRLRHGGASADGLLEGMDRITDLDLATRGRWKSLDSVRRYRRPAKYLRQLALLTPAQMRTAKASQYSIVSRLKELMKSLSVKGFVC